MYNEERLYDLVLKRTPYIKFDDKGKALGCMLPVYEAHPDFKLRFDFPSGYTDMRKYILNLLNKYCEPIDVLADLKPGDIITLKMPFGLFHLGILMKNNKFIHCSQSGGVELVNFSKYKSRFERGFRYWQRQQ